MTASLSTNERGENQAEKTALLIMMFGMLCHAYILMIDMWWVLENLPLVIVFSGFRLVRRDWQIRQWIFVIVAIMSNSYVSIHGLKYIPSMIGQVIYAVLMLMTVILPLVVIFYDN